MDSVGSPLSVSLNSLLRHAETDADLARAVLVLSKALHAERQMAEQLLPPPEGLLDLKA